MMIIIPLCFASLSALQTPEPAPQFVASFPPGSLWTYSGRIVMESTGRLDKHADFPFRASYLALTGIDPGDLVVLLQVDFAAGTARDSGASRDVAATTCGSYLHLASDLSRKTMFQPRSFGHDCAYEVEFAPFPPDDGHWQVGQRITTTSTIKVGEIDYSGSWIWLAEGDEQRVRLRLQPQTLPMASRAFGDRKELLAFDQTFELAPKTGRLLGYTCRTRMADRYTDAKETIHEVAITLQLQDADTVPPAELARATEQFATFRQFLLGAEFTETEPSAAALTSLYARLSDSRVLATARGILEPFANHPREVRRIAGGRVHERTIANPAKAARLDGAPAPDFVGKDLDGRTVALADLRGKVVLVNFWASWCGPCRAEIPHLNALAQRFAARGLAVLGLNQEGDQARAIAAARQLQIGYPVLLDMSKSYRDYWVAGIPVTVLVDRQGIVRGRWEGFRAELEAELATAIERQVGVR